MKLKINGVCMRGETSDVYMCRDMESSAPGGYVLWSVKNRETVKILAAMDKIPCINIFAGESGLCYLLEKREPRPVKRFFRGDLMTLGERRQIYRDITALCMTEPVDMPLLYLMLRQEQLHIDRSRKVYFAYLIDLDELEGGRTEKDCVMECARFLLKLMHEGDREDEICRKLIERKLDRGIFETFPELYKDLEYLGDRKRLNPAERFMLYIRNIGAEKRRRLLKIFLTVTAILAAAAIIMFLSKLIFGDLPLLRIFGNGFEHIGTESLSR